MEDKSSLRLYRIIKYNWGREKYIECCSKQGREGIAWMRTGALFLRGYKKGNDNQCVICGEIESSFHYLIYCEGTKEWRKEIWVTRWEKFSEEIIATKMLTYRGMERSRKIGEYLGKVKEKWMRSCKREEVRGRRSPNHANDQGVGA